MNKVVLYFGLKLKILTMLLLLSQVNESFAQACGTAWFGADATINAGSVRSVGGFNYTCQSGQVHWCRSNTPTDPAMHSVWISKTACSSCSAVNAGSIGGGTTICAGSTTNLTNSANASGGNGSSYSYQWETSFNGGAWTNASGTSTSATYTTAVLAAGSHQFRRKVTSSTCGNATTGAVTVTVNPASVAGSIAGGTTPLCQGTATGTMTLSGHTGSIVQWQKRVNSGSWTNISNTATTYSETPSSAGTWEYRAEVKSGACASVFSTVRTIVVDPTSVGGTIAGSATVCSGTNSTVLTLSGHTGSVTRWESSLNNFATAGTSIANTTTTLTATNLTATTTYRAVVTSGSCAAANSATAIVTVSPVVNYGTVASGNQTICNGATPSSMSVSGAVGSGSFTYQWYSQSGIVTAPTGSSTAGWTSIGTTGGANTATYTPASGISSSTTYACLVTPGGSPTCGTGTWATSARQVTVSAPLSVSPGGVSDQLLVWLKADAGTSSLGTSWQDQGCNANHYTTVSGPTVISNDINFNPAIEILSGGFNGPAGAAIGTSWTLFSVHRLLPSDAFGRFIESATGNNLLANHDQFSNGIYLNGNPMEYNNTGIATTTNTQTQTLYCYSRDNSTGNIIVRVNGTLLKTFTSTNTGNGLVWDLDAGAFAVEATDARIGEFIIYNKALNATEFSKVETYLAAKYGLQLNTTGGGTNGDLVSSGGTTYWDASAHTGYSNEVLVIGKDNNAALVQKQAKSADDSLRVFVSTLAANNSANAGTITNDQSFIALGHNGAKLKANYGSNNEKPVGITSRLAREWKLVNTNFADNFSIEAEWDSIGNVSLSDLRLLVDDDGDFSNATVYSSANGLTFAFGSIIVKGISTSMIPLNSTKYITIGSASASTPLPVQLIYFNGELMEDNVLLSWQTASEINNEKFIVEKSFDTKSWFSIAELKGAGNSANVLNYSFFDDALILGTQYYRLTQIDFDGTKETFKAIDVSKIATAPFEIKVFPNPMNEEVKVSFFADKQGYSRFRIYAESGQEMYFGLVGTLQGENSFSFNTSHFAEGIYVFKIEKENGVVSTVKVVK